MTIIERLDVSKVRNIDEISIYPAPSVNLIFGPNGSGKTSILESIHMLGVGRSFRSTRIAPFIQNGADTCTLYASLGEACSVGLTKSRNQRHLLKLQGKKQSSWVEVARSMPLQILDSSAFLLLEGSPKTRRRFLDWGVFHVEHSFIDHWRNSRTCIANRNQLLRAPKFDVGQLKAWDLELCQEAACVDRARSRYFNDFLETLDSVLANIAPFAGLSFSYYRGWDAEKDLADIFAKTQGIERQQGSTLHGPHKADIRVKIGRTNASELLSRGQMKLVVTAMKIAQGALFARQTERNCIYLVDDLPAELDESNRSKVCKFLLSLGCQVFMTSADRESLQKCWEPSTSIARFHVEHGKIMQS